MNGKRKRHGAGYSSKGISPGKEGWDVDSEVGRGEIHRSHNREVGALSVSQ